jgi:5-methylcytosine-specific restriction protein A
MPTLPPRFNSECLATKAKSQYCYDKNRGSASKRGYDRAWQKVRVQHLQMEPLCRFCKAQGLVKAAQVVDHIQTVRDRPDLRLDHANLRSLCESHHNARTASDTARQRSDG